MTDRPVMLLLGSDLRLADNPALHKAVAERGAVIPVFIWEPEEEEPWPPGAVSRWWLHQSLESLQAALAKRGAKLVVRRGPTFKTVAALAKETGANRVLWNRRYEPAAKARGEELQKRLKKAGISSETCSGNVLFEPGAILNSNSKPFQVFTAFWHAIETSAEPAKPLATPSNLKAPARQPRSLRISDLGLEPEIDWAGGIRRVWQPGEAGASKRIKMLLDRVVETYSTERNWPGHEGTSRLSPHLHFGEISARQVWHQVRRKVRNRQAAQTYLRQIAWREFSYHLLFHFPHTAEEPLHPEFRHFPWRKNAKAFKAWTEGKTGYPMVDAGMRELWHTGWMHNRVRMLVASFLVKHLLIPWQEGARWFWDTLVDADLANNTMGWQWTAGCGADAAPYFRIFNPVLQGKKFDRDGDYVRRWVPELRNVPSKWIHHPFDAPAPLVEEQADSRKNYPQPIVEHETARQRALAAFAEMKVARRASKKSS